MSRNTPKLNSIGRLRIAGEATYLTEVTAALAYFQQLGLDRSGLTLPALPNAYQRVDFHQDQIITGAQNGALSFQFNPFGYSESIPSGAPTHSDPSDAGASPAPTAFDMLIGILSSALGNAVVGGYTADESGSTTSQISATTLDTFDDGQAFAFRGDTDDEWEVGWFQAISNGTPDTATLLQQLADVPATSGTHAGKPWGSYTVFSKVGQPYNFDTSNSAAGATPPQAFTMEFLGHDADDSLTGLGCFPSSISFNFERGEVPTGDVTMSVGYWTEEGSGGAPTAGTWSFPLPESVLNAKVVWGADAATKLRVSGLTVDLNLDVQPMPDVCKNGGIGGMYVAGMDPTITFNVYRDVSEEVTDFADQNGKAFTAWFGSQPGRIIAFCIPDAYVQEYPGVGEENNAVISTVVLKPGPNTGDGEAAAADTSSNTPFRIAFL